MKAWDAVRLAGCIALAAMMLFQVSLPKVLLFNRTASLPRGIYLRIPGERCRHGDIVAYELSGEAEALAKERGWLKEGELFLKEVGAMEGEEYVLSADGFYVNGHYVGKVLQEDSQGKAMPPVSWGTHRVPRGSFLPVSGHANSYDGRYSGPVPLSAIEARYVPLLTE